MTIAQSRRSIRGTVRPNGVGPLVPHANHAGSEHADGAIDEITRLRDTLDDARRELTAARTALAEARRMAARDDLTGLPNRHGFVTMTERTLAEHRSGSALFALLFVDLDGFKTINDRLGHAVGDTLLQIVGSRHSHAVRHGDVVCRHGGDEFVCLLPHLRDADKARAIARDLERTVSAPCRIGTHLVMVTASIGIALYPQDGTTLEALLQRADSAMYAAKSLGLGVVMAASNDPSGHES
jgi:diguanylate cyclase (GGDEF)-like protein